MGEIIARNMLSWLKLLIKFIVVASSWLFMLLYQRCTVTQTSNVEVNKNYSKINKKIDALAGFELCLEQPVNSTALVGYNCIQEILC